MRALSRFPRLVLMLVLLAMLLALSAHAAPPTFTPVQRGQSLNFPRDFGAHPDYRSEWWYATGWLNTPDGKPLGFQVTFFRSATTHDRANPSAFAPAQLIIGHAAISDPALGKLAHDQRSAREGFDIAYAKVGDADVKLDDWRMTRTADGGYAIRVDGASFALNLKLAPSQPVLPQGDRGYSRKGPRPEQASYYYSEPQLTTTGNVVWRIVPLQDDQELDSRRSTGAVYWEGAVTLSRDGKQAGRAYLELTGYVSPMKL